MQGGHIQTKGQSVQMTNTSSMFQSIAQLIVVTHVYIMKPASLNVPHDMVFFTSVHQLHRSYKLHAVFDGTLSWWDVSTLVEHFQYPIYCASILVLLCLWRMINNIVEGFTDFEDMLNDLISGASPHIIMTKDSIDSYHHCHSRGKYVHRILDSI